MDPSLPDLQGETSKNYSFYIDVFRLMFELVLDTEHDCTCFTCMLSFFIVSSIRCFFDFWTWLFGIIVGFAGRIMSSCCCPGTE